MGGSHCASHGGRGPLARKEPSVPDGSWSHLGPMQFALRYTTLSRRRLKPMGEGPQKLLQGAGGYLEDGWVCSLT